MTQLTSRFHFTKLAFLGALTWACSEESGDTGNLAGSGNDDSTGQAGAPSTDGKKPSPKPPEKPDELDASCDPKKLPFGGGEGTKESPYLLCATVQLDQMSQQFVDEPSTRTAHYNLTRELDYQNLLITPIGWHENELTRFDGIFDGRGHSISNFKISHVDSHAGLFAALDSNGRLTNLSLKKAVVIGQTRVGGLVGESRGEISNCHFQGEVTAKGSSYYSGMYVGGLVGHVPNNRYLFSQISNSSSSGSVQGSQGVGGLVGEATLLILKASSSDSTVTGAGKTVGGLIGSLRDGEVSNSSATGDVTGTEQTGGAFGFTKESVFHNIKASGDVKGTGFTGGVVGWTDLSSRWSLSSGHGDVEGTRGVGGFAGASTQSHIEHSWASGTVRGVNSVGGFIGAVGSGSGASNVHALGDVYGQEDTGGLLGRTETIIGDFSFTYALGRLHFTGEDDPKNFGGLCGFTAASSHIQSGYFFDENYDNEVGFLLTQAEFGREESFSLWDFETAWELDTKAKPFARPVLR